MERLRLLPVVLFLLSGGPSFAGDWQVVKSPDLGSDANSLASVAAVADNFIASPNRRNSNNRLHGIAVTPGGTLWAVGTTGVFARPERTMIMRRTP